MSYLAARACAVLMGCASLWFFYGFVRHLYGKHVDSRRIAEISTLLLALTVPHVFISQFATYDIVCFMFFTASLWMLAAAVLNTNDAAPQPQTLKQQTLMMCAGAVLFALAVLAKYVVIAYAPLLFLALLIHNRRAALLFILIVSAMLGGYVFFYRAELLQLYQNQILGTHQANATIWKIIATALEYCGFTALLAGGLFLFKKEKTLSTWLYGALVLFAVPLVAYHLRSQDVISLYKHIIYTCCFLAPIAGETLYLLLRRAADRDNDWLRALAAAVVVLAFGLLAWQLRAVHTAYPNTDAVTHLVRKNMTAQTTILSEDAYLFRYACFPTIPTKNLEEMTWFDNNHDGKHEAQDVKDAVWDGKFEYVYLNGLILRELGDELRRGVLQRHYDCILTIPFTNSTVMSPVNTGSLSLYRRRPQ
jgi:4-amino-4-deoxy-L-arabinose transferase-like glycosyltransferase